MTVGVHTRTFSLAEKRNAEGGCQTPNTHFSNVKLDHNELSQRCRCDFEEGVVS